MRTVKVKLIGTVVYYTEVAEQQFNSDGFNLQEWGEKEFVRQVEAFNPDVQTYNNCKIEDWDSN